MSTLLVCLLLAQTPPPAPPPTPAPVVLEEAGKPPPPREAIPAPADEPGEVKAFAQFIDRHLLTLDPDMTQGMFRIRQRERLYSLKDDDFPLAFSLVPEAQAQAIKAQENLRLSSTLQLIGLVSVGVGSAALVLVPLIAAVTLPLLVVALVLDVVGLALVLIAVPFAINSTTQFTSAVSMYNRGLLELRPAEREGGAGLVVPLP